MTDEDDKVSDGAARDGELLLYDFFKHLTSLAVLILGGVLIMAQSADPADVKREMLLAVLVCISVGGVMAFNGSSELVRARYTGTPVKKSLRWNRIGAPAALAFGVGMFLAIFTDSLA